MLTPAKERPVPSRVLARAAAMVFLGVGAAIGFGSAGCPANFCFLKVCDGRGECSCPLSTCADGAGFDTTQNRCRCLRGFFEVAGHCLDQQHATAYCGRGYAFENGGCVKLACKTGDTLDATTGLCVPKEQLAAQSGVQVGQGQKVGCPAGDTLVVDNGIGACVPAAQACAKDETWNGQACQKVAACPTGSAWDATRQTCIAFAQGGSDAASVDVATWAQATYGANGGAGTPSFCSTFATRPNSFGVTPGQTGIIRATLSMTFPGRDVAKGRITTQAVFDSNGAPVPSPGAAAVQAGALTSFGALATGGGKANADSAQTTVKCAVVNAAQPQAVPETGGF